MAHPATISRLSLCLSASSVSGLPVEGMIAAGSVPCIMVAPLTSHHSQAKDDMSGRSPLHDATTAWTAHTLASSCCLRRLHSVTFLHFRRRPRAVEAYPQDHPEDATHRQHQRHTHPPPQHHPPNPLPTHRQHPPHLLRCRPVVD